MSTKISVQIEPLVHGDTTITNTGLVVKSVGAGEIFSVTKSVDKALSSAPLSTVKVYYVKGAVSTVNLKCTLSHVDTGTVPSTPSIVTDTDYVEYTLSGSTGQVNSLSIDTALTSFSSINENDSIGLGIFREDTDSGDFEVFRIEFEFSKDVGVFATAQLYDIVTLADVKDYLNIPTSSTTDDNFLQAWISNVSREIEGENGINNKIVVQNISDEISNGTGRTKLRPLYYPIVALGVAASTTDALKLASCQCRDDVDSSWTNIEDDIDHIIWHNPNLEHVSEQKSYCFELVEEYFPLGTDNIKMSYQAGWSTVPSALKIVCIEKVVELYRNSSKAGGGRFGIQSLTKSEGGGNMSTVYKDFTERHQKMMKPYRRRI